jgi:hypothetical protein
LFQPTGTRKECVLRAAPEMEDYNWRNRILRPLTTLLTRLGGEVTSFKLLPVFNISLRQAHFTAPRPEDKSVRDCTHYLLPGIPDLWSHILFHWLLTEAELP